tara:strand:- start:5069 stop:5392 length:324 start_codon:yes stop_codon:yes gene_type:complete
MSTNDKSPITNRDLDMELMEIKSMLKLIMTKLGIKDPNEPEDDNGLMGWFKEKREAVQQKVHTMTAPKPTKHELNNTNFKWNNEYKFVPAPGQEPKDGVKLEGPESI